MDLYVALTSIVQNKPKRRRRKSEADRNESSGGTLDYPVIEKTVSDIGDPANNLVVVSISDHDSQNEVNWSPAK